MLKYYLMSYTEFKNERSSLQIQMELPKLLKVPECRKSLYDASVNAMLQNPAMFYLFFLLIQYKNLTFHHVDLLRTD